MNASHSNRIIIPTLEAIRTEKASRHLSDFIKQAWPIIEPGTTYLHNWHIDAISEYLEAVTAGQITRLIINMPPRYMKSIEVSVMWPTWEWLRTPEMRYLFASYSASLSTKHSVDRRTIIQSNWYQDNWGHIVKMASDQNVKTEFMNTQRGVMIATSVGGTSTGKGGNRIIVDDPHNPEEAQSDTQRQSGINFFNQTLYSRLDDKRKGAIIIVMQRLHENDLTGHLLEKGGWEHLCLPCPEYEKRTIILPISGRNIVREPDELLWPEREGKPEVDKAKQTLGSYGFAGQYQQRPSPAEGGIFKRHWFRYWHYPGHPLPPVSMKTKEGILLVNPEPLPEQFNEQIQSWDMAFKNTKSSAYVSGQAWGRNMADKYLLDQIREKLSFTETLQAVRTLSGKWPLTRAKLIEEAANGAAVIDSLNREIPGIIPVNPQGSKEARAHAVSPDVEAENVYLPHPAIYPWVNDLTEELVTFPNSKYKDQVDCFTQALARFTSMPQISVKPIVIDATSLWRT